ncbi:MAG: hypothetical protein Q8R44_03630 [Novosphingobium sp.]|nr:hypothetical protein [Novosphingobium sp.]
MDLRVRSLRLLIAAATLTGAGVAAGAAGESAFQALMWTAPGHEAAVLTRQPATCLGERANDPSVIAGRALFNAPQLLGGQAARAGISCASCHSNGRRNPHFQLAGISDGPGTADVSASFFSVARSNATFDPRPIPDLAQPGRISLDPESRDLERFLHGLIVEEFSGASPADAALGDLATFVRAVRPCADRDNEAVRLAARIDLFRDSLRSAARATTAGDLDTAAVLAGAARTHLGLIDERLAPGGHALLRKELLRNSRRVQAIQDGAWTADALLDVLARFDRTLAPRLVQAEKSSLYRPEKVQRWVAQRAR